jgi:hypothetical protein
MDLWENSSFATPTVSRQFWKNNDKIDPEKKRGPPIVSPSSLLPCCSLVNLGIAFTVFAPIVVP